MKLKKNVGKIDQLIRYGIALVFARSEERRVGKEC